MVSPLLFNFFAWILGFSDEPILDSYIELDEKDSVKVFSLCQDFICVSSRGKTQTPKALSLALTVRQMSGCSSLIKVLHGLGHCVSLSSTMSYDSALAQLTINTSNIVPKDIVPGKHVNLVFDNIDFKEDSGKQTHVTNGIIIQQVVPEVEIVSTVQCASEPIKKKQRTVPLPTSTIMPYAIGAKKTPTFNTTTLGSMAESNEVVKAHQLDLLYCMVKYFGAGDEEAWPGWTGFNTLLRNNHIPPVSRVGYLPLVDASPTEYSTLREVLEYAIRIMDQLQLQQTVIVFDEAVYAKVQHIRWKEPIYHDRLVVRLGEFHACMSFLSAIGKIFGDGGLKVLKYFLTV